MNITRSVTSLVATTGKFPLYASFRDPLVKPLWCVRKNAEQNFAIITQAHSLRVPTSVAREEAGYISDTTTIHRTL